MSQTDEQLVIAKSEHEIGVLPKMANRHGLIAGATGTGKTVTLRVLAEAFSRIGVPVFLADVKGDLSGIIKPGGDKPKVAERVATLGLKDFQFRAYPLVFWDVDGVQGHPVRTTISEMGPLLLGRILNLNDTQSGVLTLVFKIADDNGMLLLDLKDLRAMLQYVGDKAEQFRTQYGNVSAASIGAIQRNLLTLEHEGGGNLFGEPALNFQDFLQTSAKGEGVINILTAEKLINAPKVYATLLLWLLTELFEKLPEVGDPPKPTCVFFFDEAHLLFADAPKILLDKIEQMVRLIRSKGVGVYFVTQSPLDLPDTVLGQLGNRVQHALRAFTPRDQKAVKAAAQTLRAKPGLDAETAITELQVGEALISFLDDKGRPNPVERAYVIPPASRIGPLSAPERAAVIQASSLRGHYEQAIDRESAYEKLTARAHGAGAVKPESGDAAAGGAMDTLQSILMGSTGPRGGRHPGLVDALAKSVVRTVGSQIGRELVRGVLGGLLGGRRK
jgi:DNA helicase HerA-like ATPase